MIKSIGNLFYKLDTFNKKQNMKNLMWMLMFSTGLFIIYSIENFHQMVSSGVLGFITAPLYIIIPSGVAIVVSAFIFNVLWMGKRIPFSYSLQTASVNEFIAAICSSLMLSLSKESLNLSNETVALCVFSLFFVMTFIFAIATSKHIHDRDRHMFLDAKVNTDENFLMDDDDDEESFEKSEKYEYPYEAKVVKGIIGNMVKSVIYLIVRFLVVYGFIAGASNAFM